MEILQPDILFQIAKPRAQNSHKGDFGHVLVIGGDVGFSGAVRLAAEAALRVGAGLVSVATHPRHADTLNLNRPEIMSHAINTAQDLLFLLEKATICVLGPGLGQSDWSHEIWQIIHKISQFCVLDADGLNRLANFPFYSDRWILTPHPGEAARLLQQKTSDIQQNREASVMAIQKKFGGVAVLKGAGTLIATEKNITKCEAGNPGMASGGMGDVLSGVMGGLLAQGLSLENAAKCGVLCHAMAGDLAKKTGERGMIASDLMLHLRWLVNLNVVEKTYIL